MKFPSVYIPRCISNSLITFFGVVKYVDNAPGVVFSFVSQITRLTAFGGFHNVHSWTAWLVCNHEKTGGHQLNNTDAKVFIPHRVNSDERLLIALNEFLVWCIYDKFYVVFDRQVFRKVFQVLDTVVIFLIPARSDKDQMDSIPEILIIHQQSSEFVHALEDQRMIFLRSVLADWQDIDFSLTVGQMLQLLEILNLTRWINSMGRKLWIPNCQDVILCPGAVHHRNISTSTNNAIESREKSVVIQFNHRQKRISRDVACVVVRKSSTGDSPKHICADGWVVSVGGNFASSDVLEDGVSERVAWKNWCSIEIC